MRHRSEDSDCSISLSPKHVAPLKTQGLADEADVPQPAGKLQQPQLQETFSGKIGAFYPTGESEESTKVIFKQLVPLHTCSIRMICHAMHEPVVNRPTYLSYLDLLPVARLLRHQTYMMHSEPVWRLQLCNYFRAVFAAMTVMRQVQHLCQVTACRTSCQHVQLNAVA